MGLIEMYTVEGNFPVSLGSALRNPAYSYPFFGIEGSEQALRVASDRAYGNEWKDGTPQQMSYVIEAAQTAGIGNCSDMLRELQARTVYHILELPRMKQLKRVNYTEPGAGVSTVILFKYLNEQGYDLGRLFSTLIEPSETRLSAAVEELKKMGLKEDKHFVPVIGKDTEMFFYLEPNSQHIVAANATLHHHAYQDMVFKAIHHVLSPGGSFANFDWYECLCEHPARIYRAMRDHEFKPPIEWETKENDLAAYAAMFPNALSSDYPEFSPADEMAASMITTFWFDGWAVARARAIQAGEFDPRDDYFLHEAHGRPEPQIELLHHTGFDLNPSSQDIGAVMEAAEYNGNPHQILTRDEMLRLKMDELYDDIPPEGSNLLMGTLAQKPNLKTT